MVVLPALMPVTIPVDPMVAAAVFVLDHVPPAVASVKEIAAPAHTLVVPVIAATLEVYTDTRLIAETVPQPFVTV